MYRRVSTWMINIRHYLEANTLRDKNKSYHLYILLSGGWTAELPRRLSHLRTTKGINLSFVVSIPHGICWQDFVMFTKYKLRLYLHRRNVMLPLLLSLCFRKYWIITGKRNCATKKHIKLGHYIGTKITLVYIIRLLTKNDITQSSVKWNIYLGRECIAE